MNKKLKKVIMTILTATMLCGVSTIAFAEHESQTPSGGCNHQFRNAGCKFGPYGECIKIYKCILCGAIE